MQTPSTRRKPLWTIVTAALAVVLIGVRVVGAGSVASSFGQGRLVGELVGGPIVLGLVVWTLIWLILRRRGASEPFAQPRLLATVAVFAIIAALSAH